MNVSLVVTVIGPDRPGIVSLLADRGHAFGANWAESRMASLAGEFAGIVHWQVPGDKADAMASSLRELEAQGLRIVIARGEDAAAPATQSRRLDLELVGNDRPGIVHDVSRTLGDRGISIEELHTEITTAPWSGEPLFKATATLSVPAAITTDALRVALEDLANELMVDLSLREESADASS